MHAGGLAPLGLPAPPPHSLPLRLSLTQCQRRCTPHCTAAVYQLLESASVGKALACTAALPLKA